MSEVATVGVVPSAPQTPATTKPQVLLVKVVDFDISVGNLIVLFLKMMLASLPVLALLAMLAGAVTVFLAALAGVGR